MSAGSHPILGLMIGCFIIAACAPTSSVDPTLMRSPKFHSGELIGAGEKVSLGPEDFMELALAAGPAPTGPQALRVHLECTDSETGDLHFKDLTSPWTDRILGRELIPPSALHPRLRHAVLDCFMDLALHDDEGNIHFQEQIPLNLEGLGAAGTLTGLPTEQALQPEDFKQLETPFPQGLRMECEDLGESTWGSPAADLKKLMANYIKETHGEPSESQKVACRIHHQNLFTPVFEFLRPHEDLMVSFYVALRPQGAQAFLEVDIHLSNPNPFAVDLFVGDEGRLWEDFRIQVTDRTLFRDPEIKTISLGPQGPLWHLSSEMQPGQHTLKEETISGHFHRLPAGAQLILKSRKGIRAGRSCFTPASSLSVVALQPAAFLPIWLDFGSELRAQIRWPEDHRVLYLPPAPSKIHEVAVERWPRQPLPEGPQVAPALCPVGP